MELWDVLDEAGNKTGRTVRREDPRSGDEWIYHLVVNVWIRNPEGLFLITRRSPSKKDFPGYWETTGGSAVSGEESLAAAVREVKEEIGLSFDPSGGRFLKRSKREHFKDFLDVWLFRTDARLCDLSLQEEEVSDAKWADPDEIRRMVSAGEFIPAIDYFDEFFGK